MRKLTYLELLLIIVSFTSVSISILEFESSIANKDLWLNQIEWHNMDLKQLMKDHPNEKAYQITFDLNNKLLELNKK